MAGIEEIRNAFRKRQYEYTLHGARQRISRYIYENEVEEAILNGEIIEDYPYDKYGPSCLIFGKTEKGRPIHVQVSALPSEIKVITVYEPNPKEWIDYRTRRRTDE